MANPNTSSSPPRWLDQLLEWFCADEFLEIVQGDLHEMYYRNLQEKGRFKAKWNYLGDVLSLFRPFALGFNLPHFQITTTDMYRNYFTTAFRNFKRQWSFALINVFGLAIGMAAFMIILTYVSFELSYDDYHVNKNQLYSWQIFLYRPDGEQLSKTSRVSPPFAHLIRENMPEVKEVARLYYFPAQSPYITISFVDNENIKTSFNEEYTFFADEAFLNMFNIKMLVGDSLALHELNTIILSESAAVKYFGSASDDILGQVLQVPYRPDYIDAQYKITGIYQDLPPNSHLRADMLLSYRTLVENVPSQYEDNWHWFSTYTYIQLHPHVTEEQFRQKKSQYVELINDRYQSEYGNALELRIDYDFLSIDDVYFQSIGRQVKPSGNAQIVYFLFIIGILVIFIAWVNYVNLTTARALQRAKEVGVRKVAGARRWQLTLQFLFEAFTLNLLSLLISFFIIWVSLPYFRQLTAKPLSYHLWVEGLPNMPLFFVVLGLLFLFSSLLSGFYPALVLSSFQPLKTLKGRLLQSSSGGVSLRSGLVIIQFAMSVILIAGTYLMYRQVKYMQNQSLGFEGAQMLVIKTPTDTLLKADALEVYKDDLLRQSFVENATVSSSVPGRQIRWGNGIGREKGKLLTGVGLISVDHEFLEAYDFTLVAGRNFSKAYGTDGKSIVLNETLASMLGFETAEAALHQEVWLGNIGKKEIIGIVKDFHQFSLKEDFGHIGFLLEGTTAVDYKGEPVNFKDRDRTYLSVKTNFKNLERNLAEIEKRYSAYFSGYPFEYFFLDDDFNRQYISDLQFGKTFGIFAGLAIFIACLGILGLSSFMAVQKSKEIGIRKVLGATVTNIVLLLSSRFVKLVLIASLIALPLAYFVFNNWLENYAFRIEIGWWFFVIPILVVFLIAIATISMQTVKAALANPVDSLKYE